MTIVVAGTVVTIEIAIKLARGVARSNHRANVRFLGIVAGPEAFGIQLVDQAIAVVVQTITTSVDLVLAARYRAD
jgi:hypothetical protein